MFENIGHKLQSLAVAITIIFIILGLIIIIVPIANDFESEVILISVISGILTAFFGYIGSWALYGFGHLIETVDSINKKLYLLPPMSGTPENANNSKAKSILYPPSDTKSASWLCSFCGTKNLNHTTICNNCGKDKNDYPW